MLRAFAILASVIIVGAFSARSMQPMKFLAEFILNASSSCEIPFSDLIALMLLPSLIKTGFLVFTC